MIHYLIFGKQIDEQNGIKDLCRIEKFETKGMGSGIETANTDRTMSVRNRQK